jgi:tRNA A-37 threonylcarbamoyl transferase component Bud32/TolA-binding protein
MKGLDAESLPDDLPEFEEDSDPEEPVSLLPIGSLIGGKYMIKRVLGTGGYGAVYEGEHTAIGHRVAIKVARLSSKEREHALARFSREARICGSLRHPNVGQVYDVGMLDDGAPYMVMELQEGRSLAEIFAEMQLPIVALVDITRQLLAGLAAAHAAGVIHRDIKPDNVMIVRDVKGDIVVKLVDFGISKTVRNDGQSSNTDEDFIVGSPDYMAPEQFRGTAIDARTDLYAVGVLLYEGITGRLPFVGESMADLLIAVFKDKVEPPTALRADCPPELERIVLTAMSRDSVMRPHSADQMSRALDQLRGQRQEGPANLMVLDEQVHDRRPTGGHRRRTVDLRTLRDLGAQVDRRTRVARERRGALIVAGGIVALALIVVLGRPRATPATPVPPPNPTPAALAPSTPPAPVPAPPAPVPAPPAPAAAVEPPRSTAPVAPEASVPGASPQRAPRTTPARAARRTAPKTASAPAPATAKPSTADATAATTLFREAASAFVRGDSQRARDLYLQVLARDPARADAYRGLGLAAARLGRRAEASRAFERYLQVRPNAPDAARIRAELAKLR